MAESGCVIESRGFTPGFTRTMGNDLRRRGDFQPRFLALAFPLIPAVSLVTSATIVANQIWAAPRDSALGPGLILLGLPVYFFSLHRSTTKLTARKATADADHRLP